jgi:EAL domain-containing protein (putative c-di-GMP-specific phosphodiesterase class I)
MIIDVGAWALRRALLDHQHWTEQHLAPPRVAVNVSAVQLRRRDFIQTVRDAIGNGPDEPVIDVEITESLLLDNVDATVQTLRAIRDIGLNISIDDFGTGYSSLSYLAKLPVTSLKIDRSFIDAMMDDPDTAILVSTIISLAHSLRLKVVAEGVENEEQVKVWAQWNCDEMQGYLISPLVSERDFGTLLRAARA